MTAGCGLGVQGVMRRVDTARGIEKTGSGRHKECERSQKTPPEAPCGMSERTRTGDSGHNRSDWDVPALSRFRAV